MKNSNQIELFTPSGCLSYDGMSKAAAGDLDKTEAAAVQSHLASCILCREAMQGVTKLGSSSLRRSSSALAGGAAPGVSASLSYHIEDIRSRVRKTYPREQVFNTPMYYAVAATVAMVIIISLVIWYPVNKVEMAVNKTPEKSSIPVMGAPMQEKEKKNDIINTKTETETQTLSRAEADKNAERRVLTMDDLSGPIITVTESPAGPGQMSNEIVINKDGDVNLLSQSADEEKENSASGGGSAGPFSLASQKTSVSAGYRSKAKKESNAPAAKSDGSMGNTAYRVSGQYDKLYSRFYTLVEEAPKFAGGESGLNKYIKRHLVYPEKAIEDKIEGKVIVQFMVNETGGISDAKVVQGVDELLDKEALKVISNLPKWEPGKVGGNAVKVYYIIPVEFKLP